MEMMLKVGVVDMEVDKVADEVAMSMDMEVDKVVNMVLDMVVDFTDMKLAIGDTYGDDVRGDAGAGGHGG